MSHFKGWIGERISGFSLWVSLNNKQYTRFNNIFIPSPNGTAQIDHLIISEYGLFIIESKHYKGWIFGSENSKNWTQMFYKKKYPFQNPLRQTFRQKKLLAEYLKIEDDLIHDVIFFSGKCQFKSKMPDNVTKNNPAKYILKFNESIISPKSLKRINQKLELNKLFNTTTNKAHVKALEVRHTSVTDCPTCGSSLVERKANKGKYKGHKFIGCSNYPKCKYIRQIN